MLHPPSLWKNALALAAGLLCTAQAAAQCAGVVLEPGQPAAQVVALSGRGETRPAGAAPWQPAALSQTLGAGADMRTLALSSAALLLADRTQIRMAAQAQLRLCESRPARTLLELVGGRLWARTKKTPAALELQTPAALAVVRGTDWDVEVEEGGRTTLTVLSGRIAVSNALGAVDVGPSEQATVEPGQAPVKRLLVQPRERVQWVMDSALDVAHWAAALRSAGAAPLATAADALETGRWPEARAQLRALAARGEGGALAERLLAELELADGQPDAAQARLERAWQRTQDPRAAARRAGLLMALDRSQEARAWLDATRVPAPDDAALLLADADWHRLEGQGDAALRLYRQAVAQAPDAAAEAAAQAGLGRALQERGDLFAARAALERAVELAPDQSAYRAERATAATEALRAPDILVKLAKCCTPVPGDHIAGYLGRGEGLVVHTQTVRFSGASGGDGRFALPDNANARTRVLWNHPLGSAFPTMSPAGVGVEVHAFRQRTALFGHNAPDPNLLSGRGSNLAQKIDRSTPSNWTWKQFHIDGTTVDLESANPKITAGTWFALVSNEAGLGSADLPGYTELYRAQRVSQLSRNDFGISGKTTRLTPDTTENLSAARFGLRNTLVLAQSERLATVDTPLFHPVQGDALTLGQRVDGLLPGQALAVSGTRQRIAIAAGAKGLSLQLAQGGSVALTEGDELFMTAPASRLLFFTAITLGAEAFTALLGQPSARLRLALTDRDGRSGTLVAKGHELRLAPARKDDPLVREIAHIADTGQAVLLERDHTQLKLDAALRHVYERASVRINGNVAPATHGETVEALLGNGDAGSAGQRFVLNQAPLTYVSAPTASGGASTLELRVADVLWTEAPTLYQASPGARVYQTRQDDDGLTTVEFGDGVEGARLPSGQSNVRARYRKGLGVAGNVAAGQLTTLLSRPLGVSEVVNPEPATGGEDGELLERARENAPLTVLTLDRAVSITDYASFARAFAGIDKAHALWIPAGPAQGVFLTIAGVDGAVVPPSGATFASLGAALRSHGDALVPLHLRNHLGVRFRVRLSVKVLASHETDPVLQALEAALRAHFSFARRQFGQTVSVDEVAAVAQAVAGVQAVHVTRLHRVGQAPGLLPRLFAALPVASLTGQPLPAELLTLADEPVELEVMP